MRRCCSSEGGVHNNLELGLRTTTSSSSSASLFVKVYMEGHPIGRKLDILAHTGYRHLVSTLDRMFNANILLVAENSNCHPVDFHVLTYEDDEGDWIMVGDVPWELFLGAVRRLKISRPCPCT